MLDHGPGKLAAVELLGAALREQLERAREVGHHEPVAGDEALAFIGVERLPLLGMSQDQVEDRVEVRLGSVQLDAASRELDRGREQLAPRERPEGAVRLLQPGRGSGDGARRGADVEDLIRVAEGDVDVVHRAALVGFEAAAGDVDEEVEQPCPAVVAAVDEHETAAARAGERALCHPRREGGRDARVDGVAALGEHAGAGLGGQRVAGGDRTSHRSRVIRRWRNE